MGTEYDMLWDQRVTNIDGIEYTVSVYCFKFNWIANNGKEYTGYGIEFGKIVNGKIEYDGCIFNCEAVCLHPLNMHNNDCFYEEVDCCPLKKTYKE